MSCDLRSSSAILMLVSAGSNKTLDSFELKVRIKLSSVSAILFCLVDTVTHKRLTKELNVSCSFLTGM